MMASFCNTLLTCLILCIMTVVKVSSNDPKIVGGFEAQKGDFGYQVSLKYNGYHRCGGTIVNPKHVITAGHCIMNDKNKMLSVGKLKVHVGTTSISGKGGATHYIIKIYLSKNYSTISIFTSDIAVLRMKVKFRFNDFVRPVPIAQYAYTPDADCTISGWGRTHSKNKELPANLHYAAVKIVDRNQCINWLHYNLANDMLCAGYYQGGVDSCQGDSGGPLVCNNSLTGVVSHGAGCAMPKNPGIYTDVHYHHKWISDIINSSITSVPFVPLLFSIIFLEFIYF